MKTFVYDGIEVKKTGRTATKEIKTVPTKTIKNILVEITPVESDLDWKKWVNPDHLYIVNENED